MVATDTRVYSPTSNRPGAAVADSAASIVCCAVSTSPTLHQTRHNGRNLVAVYLIACPTSEVLVSTQPELGGDTPPDGTSDVVAGVEALRGKLREARMRGLTLVEQASIEELMRTIAGLLGEARYVSQEGEGGPASLS